LTETIVIVAERVQKYLSRMGRCSRRQAERWIRQGRVAIDGFPASLGATLAPGSTVSVDGIVVGAGSSAALNSEVLLYNKPIGRIVTRTDPANRPTVFTDLPEFDQGRWVAVGRLDINTAGLMLFCSDGDLAHALMHPSAAVEREYMCRVRGEIVSSDLQCLKDGIELDGHLCRFASIDPHPVGGHNRWYSVVLRQGRHREVRRLWQAVGGEVNRLIRVRYGFVKLPRDLGPAATRLAGPDVCSALYSLVGMLPPET
jgi:23S rRNA pseudouridine2605 synthase